MKDSERPLHMAGQNVLHRVLLFVAALALVAAASLVVGLQRQSARHQQTQTAAIVQQSCRQAVSMIRQRLRDDFAAAVSETIEGIGHPELVSFDLPRIAQYFAAGQVHPYVDRYFIWSERMRPLPRGEVLFYGPSGDEEKQGDTPIPGLEGESLGKLYASSEFGRAIWSRAMEFLPLKRSFAVVDQNVDGRPTQLVIHFIWGDLRRDAFAALVGFTVDFTRMPARVFGDILTDGTLSGQDGVPPGVKIAVGDDRGAMVFGTPPEPDMPSASAPLEMLFMARSFEAFTARRTSTPSWTITASCPLPVAAGTGSGYWLFGTVVFLILVGLACAVALDREGRRLANIQSEFIAHVSHQLKTPLALLSGAAETLGRGRVSSAEKITEYARIVHAQSTRLSALVEQAIVFSVAGVGGAGLRFDIVDVAGLVRDAVDNFALGIPTGLAIRFRADEAVPLVKADSLALEQVVWNLLENAMQYGHEDNAIDVMVTSTGRHAIIVIRDRGEGIAPEDIQHVFDKFYRGRGNGQHRRGFGLGLAYVQKVVVAHGGRVWVNSEPGLGAEFRVHLPAA